MLGLYGTKFGDENGHEYIMQFTDFLNLDKVMRKLQELYKNKLNLSKDPDIITDKNDFVLPENV